MAALTLKNLVKIYPFTNRKDSGNRRETGAKVPVNAPPTSNEGVIAVQAFSLEVEHGEFLVLLGPSGCGKTTVLRMIAGLEEPSEGEILMDGIPLENLPPERRDMAMVFQNHALYPHLNVYDNLAFALRNKRVPRDELNKKVMETAELLMLTPFLHRMPKELSGGQQQRVALGRAAIRNPRVMLLDEPFSNQDSALRARLRGHLKNLHKTLGITMIYVTHDQTEAMSLATRIVVMDRGQIQQAGTPREIYNRPVNQAVAVYSGLPQMNFIPGAKLVKTGEAWRIALFNQWFDVPSGLSGRIPREFAGGDFTAGIRPVHVMPSETGIPCRVLECAKLEAETHLRLMAGEAEMLSVYPATAANSSYRPGQETRVSVSLAHLLLFDPVNGRRFL